MMKNAGYLLLFMTLFFPTAVVELIVEAVRMASSPSPRSIVSMIICVAFIVASILSWMALRKAFEMPTKTTGKTLHVMKKRVPVKDFLCYVAIFITGVPFYTPVGTDGTIAWLIHRAVFLSLGIAYAVKKSVFLNPLFIIAGFIPARITYTIGNGKREAGILLLPIRDGAAGKTSVTVIDENVFFFVKSMSMEIGRP